MASIVVSHSQLHPWVVPPKYERSISWTWFALPNYDSRRTPIHMYAACLRSTPHDSRHTHGFWSRVRGHAIGNLLVQKETVSVRRNGHGRTVRFIMSWSAPDIQAESLRDGKCRKYDMRGQINVPWNSRGTLRLSRDSCFKKCNSRLYVSGLILAQSHKL